MSGRIPREVVPRARASRVEPARVAREFRRRLDEGALLRPAGSATRRPKALIEGGYLPRHRFRLFDWTFELTDARENDDIRFFVAYLQRDGAREIFPRIEQAVPEASFWIVGRRLQGICEVMSEVGQYVHDIEHFGGKLRACHHLSFS